MIEADAAAALERQGAGLDALLARLDHVRACVVPLSPAQQWTGPAQSAYESRLRELRALVDDSVAMVETARDCTRYAVSRLAAHVG